MNRRAMKLVYPAPSLIGTTQLKDFLEREGIPCILKNDILAGIAGEVPWTETFPEVWVVNDSDFARAEALKADWLNTTNA